MKNSEMEVAKIMSGSGESDKFVTLVASLEGSEPVRRRVRKDVIQSESSFLKEYIQEGATEIEIPLKRPNNLNLILEYVNEGQLTISNGIHLESLWNDARILGLVNLEEVCIQRLADTISLDSWTWILEFSQAEGLHELESKVISFVNDNFAKCCSSSKFTPLSLDQMVQVLQLPNAKTTVTEPKRAALILAWIKANENGRCLQAHRLLEQIDLMRLTENSLRFIFNKEPALRNWRSVVLFERAIRLKKIQATERHSDAVKGQPGVVQGQLLAVQGNKNVLQGQPDAVQGKQKVVQGQPGAIQCQPEAVKFQPEAVKLQPEAVKLQPDAVKRQHGTVNREQNVGQGQPDVVKRQPDAVKRQLDALQGQPDAVQGKQNVVQGQPDAVQGKQNVVQGQPDAVKRQIDVVQGQPEAVKLQPVAQGQPDAVQGKKDVAQSQPGVVQGQPKAVKLQPDAVLHQPDAVQDNGLINNMKPTGGASEKYSDAHLNVPNETTDPDNSVRECRILATRKVSAPLPSSVCETTESVQKNADGASPPKMPRLEWSQNKIAPVIPFEWIRTGFVFKQKQILYFSQVGSGAKSLKYVIVSAAGVSTPQNLLASLPNYINGVPKLIWNQQLRTLCFLGNFDGNGSKVPTFNYMNAGGAPTVTVLPEMLYERHHHQPVLLNGCLYVFLGSQSVIHKNNDRLSTSEVLNMTEAKWQWKPITSTGTKRDLYAAACVEGNIYLTGGVIDRPSKDEALISDHAVRYQPRENRWKQLCPMKNFRCGHALAVLGHKIYVFGGIESICNDMSENFVNMKSAEVYDVHTNTWTLIAPMLRPRCGGCAVEVGGKIYLIGGDQSKGETNRSSVECYNPISNSWTLKSESVDDQGSFNSIAVIDDPECFLKGI